jgi:hypothetical protein
MIPEKTALEEYKLNFSAYESCRESIIRYREELANVEKKRLLLWSSDILFYGLPYLISFLLIYFIIKASFVVSLIASFYFAFYGGLLLSSSDFIKNIVSFGNFNKVKKVSDIIKKQIKEAEDLSKSIRDKLRPFEKETCDYYHSKLEQFFENNLYNKRSGSKQFEESLSEFAAIIEKLSVINSKFITTSIPLWGYENYLAKRKIDHDYQSSKKSEESVSIDNFVHSVSALKEYKKEVTAPEKLYRTAQKIDNWDEINSRRKMTGDEGEEIILIMERKFFESIARDDLADRVRHVSVEQGDGLGYDILSFFSDGREKYIEVKSTKTSLATPYYLSRNELQFFKEHPQDAFIYRVFISDNEPQIKADLSSDIFIINEITPIQYMVKAKN